MPLLAGKWVSFRLSLTVFRSLKTEWVPVTGYASLEQARLDISNYLKGYYNYQRPHSFNQGLAPAIAEEKPYLRSKII